MRRTLVLFGAVVAALLVAGYLVVRMVVGEPDRDSPSSAEASKTAPMQPAPATLEPRPNVMAPRRPATAPTRGIRLRDVSGSVEYLQPNQHWKKAQADTRLTPLDTIKTTKGGAVTLVFAGGSTLRMDDRSEVRVTMAGPRGIGVRLRRGRATVDHRSARKLVFRIESGDTGATVQAHDARFSVRRTGKRLAVASTRGDVQVTAQKKTVTVGQGQQSSVAAGKAPRAPTRIPVSVLLKLAQPRQRLLYRRHVFLSGQVSVGTELRVNEVRVQVRDDGRFRVKVPLKLGRNQLVALAKDITGRVKRLDLGVLVVRRPKATDVKVRWD